MTPRRRLERQLVAAVRKGVSGTKHVPVPPAGFLAWEWFVGLCSTRTYHAYGPNPISIAEIEAYARLHRLPLQSRHVDLLLAMDRVWLEAVQRKWSGKQVATSSDQPINAAAFDAVFG
jgi:hypothetical protein